MRFDAANFPRDIIHLNHDHYMDGDGFIDICIITFENIMS